MAGHLPKELAGVIDKRLGIIFAQPDADKGLAAARRLAKELEAERSFRRVRGYKDMAKLVVALRREVTPVVDTPEECDQAAA